MEDPAWSEAVVQSIPVPSPATTFFPKKDLLPGDVLLSCGTEPLSELIRRLDGGLYSHAAIWDGNCAVDATAKGVVRRELEQDIEAQWFIDAYRWHTGLPGNDLDLGKGIYSPTPVMKRTDRIVDDKTLFAYDQLLLAALVIWMSNQPDDPWLRASARILLSRFQVWLLDRVRKQGKKEMVCSEIVARSFDEAAQPPDYTITVIVDGSRDAAAIADAVQAQGAVSPRSAGPPVATSVSAYDDLKRKYGELIVSGMTDAEKARLLVYADAVASTDAGTYGVMTTGNTGLPPNCVSPRDLQRSPNLRKLGRVSEKKDPPNLPKSTFALFLLLVKEYLKHKAKHLF